MEEELQAKYAIIGQKSKEQAEDSAETIPSTASQRERFTSVNNQEMQQAANRSDNRWQHRLLPFMMGVLIFMGVVFILSSAIQITVLQQKIVDTPSIELTQGIPKDDATWKSLTVLESYALEHRYHQANALLLTRIWSKNLGVVTGMLLSLIGAAFILGKLREPESNVGADGVGWKFTLRTASPGMFIVFLGTALMIIAMFADARIEVTDRPVYVELMTPNRTGDMPPPATPPGDMSTAQERKGMGSDPDKSAESGKQ